MADYFCLDFGCSRWLGRLPWGGRGALGTPAHRNPGLSGSMAYVMVANLIIYRNREQYRIHMKLSGCITLLQTSWR